MPGSPQGNEPNGFVCLEFFAILFYFDRVLQLVCINITHHVYVCACVLCLYDVFPPERLARVSESSEVKFVHISFFKCKLMDANKKQSVCAAQRQSLFLMEAEVQLLHLFLENCPIFTRPNFLD